MLKELRNYLNILHNELGIRREALRNGAEAFRDSFNPSGYVEARLIYAGGPKKGNIYRSIKGKNLITSVLNGTGTAPTGGRDLMRRVIVNPGTSGTLHNVSGAYVDQMVLGTNTAAPAVSNTLATMTQVSGSTKQVASVSFDASNPYVTFTVTWNQNEANASNIAEVGLLSASARNDFLARKTFSPFTKTTDFTLQIDWTWRF